VTPRKLPVGIEMDTFRPVTDSQFASDEPTVGYSGRMTRKKHVDEILRLADRLPDVRFELVGEGPVRDDLERGAPGNVRFRDFLPRENLPAFYSALDVFVTASTCDTLGLDAGGERLRDPRSPPPTCPHLTGPLGRTTAPGSTTATSTTWSAPSSTVSTATGRPVRRSRGSPSSGR